MERNSVLCEHMSYESFSYLYRHDTVCCGDEYTFL